MTSEAEGGKPAQWGLEMPYLPVVSKGGPHDDDAYVAGWEMGMLDARLQYERPPLLDMNVHAENAEQVELIAMKHGYQAKMEPSIDGWYWLSLTVASTVSL